MLRLNLLQYDLNVDLQGGTAKWTGQGTWSAASDQAVCVDFYDPEHNKPTCCCDLAQTSISTEDGAVPLTNCSCFV